MCEPTASRDTTPYEELIRVARDGKPETVGRLLEHLRNYLLLIAEQELGPELRGKIGASDIVQESFVDAQRNFQHFNGGDPSELKAWLRKILTHRLIDVRRRFRQVSKRNVAREISLNDCNGWIDPQIDTRSPRSALIASEDEQAVRQAMQRLPEQYQQVIRLRSWEDLPFDEIGSRMGRSKEAVRKLWVRAIERLQQEIR